MMPLLATYLASTTIESVLLDCGAKDGIKSSNYKPTLLEDQRKGCKNTMVDEQVAFYHTISTF